MANAGGTAAESGAKRTLSPSSASARKRQQTGHAAAWVDGIHRRQRWSWTRIFAFAALPGFLLLALILVPLTVNRIERALEADVLADLAAIGVDGDRVEVAFDYRDGTISGFLPYDVSPQMAAEAVSHPLLRNLNVVAGVEQVTVDPGLYSPVEIQASYSGERVTLVGTVLTQEQYDRVLDAAAVAAPGAQLDDRLQITGLEAEVSGADDRIEDLVSALEQLRPARQWLIQLTDNSLRVDAGVRSATVGDRIDQLSDELLAVPTAVEVTVLEQFEAARRSAASEEEVQDLQERLDALAEDIYDDVTFSGGGTQLSDEGRATLDRVIEAMTEHPEPVVQITGYTDTEETATSNRALSQRQASAVRAYLASQGIDIQRLRARGLGASNPLPSSDDEPARNQRVEFAALSEF